MLSSVFYNLDFFYISQIIQCKTMFSCNDQIYFVVDSNLIQFNFNSLSSFWYPSYQIALLDLVAMLNCVEHIYHIHVQLEIKDTTDTARSASYLDLHLEIDSEGWLRTKQKRWFQFSIYEISI